MHKSGVLPVRQVVEDAPWQIMVDDLRPDSLSASSTALLW